MFKVIILLRLIVPAIMKAWVLVMIITSLSCSTLTVLVKLNAIFLLILVTSVQHVKISLL
jgi:hypothetical protein